MSVVEIAAIALALTCLLLFIETALLGATRRFGSAAEFGGVPCVVDELRQALFARGAVAFLAAVFVGGDEQVVVGREQVLGGGGEASGLRGRE